MNKKVAECAGLWLAEGDRKCNNEITFTNNCFELILHFHSTLKQVYKNKKYNPRIYTYSPKRRPSIKVDNCIIKHYKDQRANRPYFIYRIASVELNRKWKTTVERILTQKEHYPNILRGFFAGEGNIHVSNKHKSIRIAQKERLAFIEKILNTFNVNFSFKKRERAYVIYNRKNWDKLAKIKMADLHPIKKEKFWKVYNEFREYHYSHGFLKNKILQIAQNPITTREMAKKFNRSQARICDVLMELKKEGKF